MYATPPTFFSLFLTSCQAVPMLFPGPHPLAGLEGEGLASTLVDMLLGEQITGLPCAGLMTATADDKASPSAQ
jgi:hypothetical protein